jgi:hypothetical protein
LFTHESQPARTAAKIRKGGDFIISGASRLCTIGGIQRWVTRIRRRRADVTLFWVGPSRTWFYSSDLQFLKLNSHGSPNQIRIRLMHLLENALIDNFHSIYLLEIISHGKIVQVTQVQLPIFINQSDATLCR